MVFLCQTIVSCKFHHYSTHMYAKNCYLVSASEERVSLISQIHTTCFSKYNAIPYENPSSGKNLDSIDVATIIQF